jgi:hypothetical protein
MLKGKLVWWGQKRSFGIVEHIGADRLVKKYYLHRMQIHYSVPTEPAFGQIVVFEVGKANPNRPNDLLPCTNVYLFNDESEILQAGLNLDGVN